MHWKKKGNNKIKNSNNTSHWIIGKKLNHTPYVAKGVSGSKNQTEGF